MNTVFAEEKMNQNRIVIEKKVANTIIETHSKETLSDIVSVEVDKCRLAIRFIFSNNCFFDSRIAGEEFVLSLKEYENISNSHITVSDVWPNTKLIIPKLKQEKNEKYLLASESTEIEMSNRVEKDSKPAKDILYFSRRTEILMSKLKQNNLRSIAKLERCDGVIWRIVPNGRVIFGVQNSKLDSFIDSISDYQYQFCK